MCENKCEICHQDKVQNVGHPEPATKLVRLDHLYELKEILTTAQFPQVNFSEDMIEMRNEAVEIIDNHLGLAQEILDELIDENP